MRIIKVGNEMLKTSKLIVAMGILSLMGTASAQGQQKQTKSNPRTKTKITPKKGRVISAKDYKRQQLARETAAAKKRSQRNAKKDDFFIGANAKHPINKVAKNPSNLSKLSDKALKRFNQRSLTPKKLQPGARLPLTTRKRRGGKGGAWDKLMELNGGYAEIYDPKRLGKNRGRWNKQNKNFNPGVPPFAIRRPRSGGRGNRTIPTPGYNGGRYVYASDRIPTLSLPIGLPSYDIVSVGGFTATSNAKVDYRVIGAPNPNLGAGNLVRRNNNGRNRRRR